MGDTGHTMASMLDSVVGTTERLCGLPAVATLNWCSQAAQALSVLLAPSRVCVMVAKAEPSGRVMSLEASGCGSCATNAQAHTPPACNWATNEPESSDDGSGIELGIRSRADRLREFGFRLDALEPGQTFSATAARLGGTELWRTAPIGNIWVGSDISDLLIGALQLDGGAPARFLVVEIGLLGHGPTGPRRCSIDNHAALSSVMPLLARRAALGLARTGSVAEHTSGDLFIAFSTANRGATSAKEISDIKMLPNQRMTPLFAATVEATEEAIVNALVAGETMTGINGNTVYGLPHERLRRILKQYNRLQDE